MWHTTPDHVEATSTSDVRKRSDCLLGDRYGASSDSIAYINGSCTSHDALIPKITLASILATSLRAEQTSPRSLVWSMSRKHKSAIRCPLAHDTSHAACSDDSQEPHSERCTMSTSASEGTRRYASHIRRFSADEQGTRHACCSEKPHHDGKDLSAERIATARAPRRKVTLTPKCNRDLAPSSWCSQPQRPCGIRPVPVVGSSRTIRPPSACNPCTPFRCRHTCPACALILTPLQPHCTTWGSPHPAVRWDSLYSLPHSYVTTKVPEVRQARLQTVLLQCRQGRRAVHAALPGDRYMATPRH